MARLAGIKVEKDLQGRPSKLVIDLKKRGDDKLVEDFYDAIIARSRMKDERIPHEEVVRKHHSNKKTK